MRLSYISALIDQSVPLRLRMAGATLSGRIICSFGAFAGIYLAAIVTYACNDMIGGAHMLIAPIGASAVIAFTVPSSPMAQPWSIIGGNCLSALLGALMVSIIPSIEIASALAVASAIIVMTVTRSLHPPGGACALIVVLVCGENPGALNGMLASLALNSVVLVMVALIFHRLWGRSYPHRTAPVSFEPDEQDLLHPDDIRAALADLGEVFDVTDEDLNAIFRKAQVHRSTRRGQRRAAEKLRERLSFR